jgi:choline kinase
VRAFVIDNAVILAAGLGLRLKPLTNHAPKCLTEVHGIPILHNTLRILSELRFTACTIVVGYLSSAIRRSIGSSFEGLSIHYIENLEYRHTNDMYSLWLARRTLIQGALLIEGDIFFQNSTIEPVMRPQNSRSCYLAGRYNGSPNEILLITDQGLRIVSLETLHEDGGPEGPNRYMSSGLLLLQPDYGTRLSQWLDQWVREGRVDVLFDAVIAEHIGEMPLYVCPIGHEEWVEVDTAEDLSRAEQLFR